MKRRSILEFLAGLLPAKLVAQDRITVKIPTEAEMREVMGMPPLHLLEAELQRSDLPPGSLFEYFYRGYYVAWTGWKYSPEFLYPVGQWVAYRKDRTVTERDLHPQPDGYNDPRIDFYASMPGQQGRWSRGEYFDGTVTYTENDSYQLDYFTLGKERFDDARIECLGRLLALIDKEVGLG